ncbi:MAG TPA: magnesium transporter [Thiotrichaceae bacterium]|nr:magnesium transporter [Thiotrichaceae bacterium]
MMDNNVNIKAISDMIENCDNQTARQQLQKLSAAETAHLLDALPAAKRPLLFKCIASHLYGEVLLHMNEVAATELAEAMNIESLHHATRSMDTADVAELLDEVLNHEAANDLLESMDAQRRSRIQLNLSYEENTAGRLMHTDAITVRSDITLETVQRYLQRHDEVPKDTNVIMVVDRDNRFLGAISILSLLLQPANKLVSEVMEKGWRTLLPEISEKEVIQAFEDHDWYSAPVVDHNGYFLGRIVVDDVIDSMRDEADRAIFGSVGLDEDEDLFAPILPSVGRRTIWLALNLVTAFLVSWVIAQFEPALEKIVALAVLMPIVTSMGGIAGSQTLTLTIRGLAMGHVVKRNTHSLLKKELGIGILNGLLWSTIVATAAYFWFNEGIALVIGAALIFNMIAGALAGIIVPITLHRIKIDPALSGAVILTTVTDVVGFMTFLGLATIFLL